MVIKKLHSSIFVSIILFIFSLQSCEKKKSVSVEPKKNTLYYSYLDLAEKHLENKKKDSAFFYFNKAKSVCIVDKENTKIIYALLKMAYIQREVGDYYSTETTATEAISYFQKETDSQYECSVYSLLGMTYERLFEFDAAINYFNKAYKIADSEVQKTPIKNNIALVYMSKEDYQTAITILLPLKKKDAIVLDNLGYCYFKVGNPISLDYFNQSLKIKKEAQDDFGMVTSYVHFSEFYAQSNPNLSQKYAELAYEKASKVNNVNDRLTTLALLIKGSKGNETKKYSENYLRINDSIAKERQKAKNQFAKIKYDSKKEKDENLILKNQKIENALQLEQQKNKSLLLTFLTIIGSAFSIFLYYFLKERNKKENLKTSYDTETRIAKKLHDELANDVYQTLAFAETQDLSSTENREVLVNNLDTIYSRTRNISRENSSIETGIQFIPNLKEMMAGFNTNEVNILINGLDVIDWATLETNKKITTYRVLQELLVNMKKHSKCSLAMITFKKNENKLQIEYSDNGLGAAFEEINLKNGLLNVENRILSINGSVTFDTKSHKGFKVHIKFPL